VIRLVTFASACVFLLATPALAQQPDMDAMQKWMTAQNVSWHIVGKFDGNTAISSDG